MGLNENERNEVDKARLERLAATLRAIREMTHEFDADIAAAIDMCATEADAIAKGSEADND